MRYVTARIKTEDRDEAYRIYISDGIKALAGFKVRYYDVIYKQTEDADPDEIKARIFDKLKAIGGDKT